MAVKTYKKATPPSCPKISASMSSAAAWAVAWATKSAEEYKLITEQEYV